MGNTGPRYWRKKHGKKTIYLRSVVKLLVVDPNVVVVKVSVVESNAIVVEELIAGSLLLLFV
jgi:hypothetical protein